MPGRRNFAPAKVNAANVKANITGTDVANQVAHKDLAFWLPKTKLLLNKEVTPVDTLKELLSLPKAHQGHILSKLVTIFRQSSDMVFLSP